MGKFRNLIFLSNFIVLMVMSSASIMLFLNCSNAGDTTGNSPPNSQLGANLTNISTDQYSLNGSTYRIENYRLNGSDGPVYFQIIPGCADRCPVVVVSMPYNGIPWTTDADDLRWSNSLPNGGLTDDINGPDYISGSGQQIAYFHSNVSETVGFGGLFLPSKVTAVLVYNRFYLGRKMDNYVNDFVQVVNSLPQFTYVDTSKMGFLGASLGGFVSLHASRKTNIKPLAVAGITPLIDLKSEQTEMSNVAQRITANSSLLLSTQNFFNSYLRRMSGVNVDNYTAQKLAAENSTSEILVIHDTWDTIVSIDQYRSLAGLRSVDAFIFQHTTAINYNTFSMDHSQSSEGFTTQKVFPVFMSYLLNRIKSPSEEKIIYYSSTDFLTGVSEIKAAQDRGQNISWFKSFIDDLCTGGFQLTDYASVGNLGTLSGAQMAGGLIANVWNKPTSIDNGCAYLQANSNMFD